MKLFFGLIMIVISGIISDLSAQEKFPDSWTGNYKGDLLVYSVDSVRMKIGMELKIAETRNDSVFKWTIIYDFKEKKDVRAYELLVVDRSKGLYKIDEKNSIVIESYLRNNNILTSFFKVMNSFIIATYTKKEDTIVFEIMSSASEPVSTTGNTKNEKEEIPEVNTFPVNGRQKAVLFKY